jgi:hypothetical protein
MMVVVALHVGPISRVTASSDLTTWSTTRQDRDRLAASTPAVGGPSVCSPSSVNANGAAVRLRIATTRTRTRTTMIRPTWRCCARPATLPTTTELEQLDPIASTAARLATIIIDGVGDAAGIAIDTVSRGQRRRSHPCKAEALLRALRSELPDQPVLVGRGRSGRAHESLPEVREAGSARATRGQS